jgi:nicotinamidase-related amidase
MTHPRILDSNHAALLVVDIQEAFRKYVGDFERFVSRAITVVRGFQILELPVFVTEQYPKGLGQTVAEIREVLPADFDYFEKTTFSSCGATQLEKAFRDAGAKQIVICGLETHVCVNQTAHDLLDRGFDVHVLTDCVGSRSEENRQAGLAKMFASGAVQSSIEMALFELMRDATHEKFKRIQQIIK